VEGEPDLDLNRVRGTGSPLLMTCSLIVCVGQSFHRSHLVLDELLEVFDDSVADLVGFNAERAEEQSSPNRGKCVLRQT